MFAPHQCNGVQPCDTCLKRNLICSFGVSKPEDGSEDLAPPVKRRVVDQSTTSSQTASPAANVSVQLPPPAPGPEPAIKLPPIPRTLLHQPSVERAAQSIGLLPTAYPTPLGPQTTNDQPPPSSDLLSHGSKEGSAHDEEAIVYTSARMLQDPTGRLCTCDLPYSLKSCLQCSIRASMLIPHRSIHWRLCDLVVPSTHQNDRRKYFRPFPIYHGPSETSDCGKFDWIN